MAVHGDGDGEGECECECLKSRGLAEVVEWAGWIPKEAAGSVFGRAAEVCLLTFERPIHKVRRVKRGTGPR